MKYLATFLRRVTSARDAAVPALLGQGIDCIILRTTRAPRDADRLLRYARAKSVFYAQTAKPAIELQMLDLRTRLGQHYRSAWAAGRFPRFSAIGRPGALRFLHSGREARAS